MLQAILNISWKQHPHQKSYTATYLQSLKPSKLDEQGIGDTAVGVKTNS